MRKLKSRVIQHLQVSWWVYLFVGVCFVAGLIFGSFGVSGLDDRQASSLGQFLEEGLSQFEGSLNLTLTARQAIIKNLANLGKIFVLGLTVIGFPFIMVIVFNRGFVLGFTVAFLIKEKTFTGGLIALLAVLPPSFLTLPAYILAAVTAINFSLFLARGRDATKNASTSQYFVGYLLVMLGLSLLMLGGAIIEGYLSPFFIQLLSQYAGFFLS